METERIKPIRRHDGYAVRRIRETIGVKQASLASDLGITQQAVSALEQKEYLDEDLLKNIADILKIPVEAIKNYNEEGIINIISSTFQDNSMSGWYAQNYNYTVNPIEKIEELYKEKEELYKQMLKERDEFIKKLMNK